MPSLRLALAKISSRWTYFGAENALALFTIAMVPLQAYACTVVISACPYLRELSLPRTPYPYVLLPF
jgi:hypothetical protein